MLLKENTVNEFVESIYDSSNLFKTIYNRERKELFIFFHRGGVYLYYPISEEFYKEMNEAESQGKFFHAKIKNNENIKYRKGFKMFDFEKKELVDQIKELKEKISEEENLNEQS